MNQKNPLVVSSKLLSQQVVAVCKAKAVSHIVISPGSRNAPLILGFTSDPFFNCYSIVDERCAAFFALGLAQQIKAPVAVVCTSGSAMLNYFPAVAEAFYSDYPLIVLSGDRPANLQEIGDGQTIQQEGVYGKHILYQANCKEGASFERENLKKIDTALNTAIQQSGPVHINAPFSEPLYETVRYTDLKLNLATPNRPITQDAFTVDDLLLWQQAQRILVLVGELPANVVASQQLNKLAKDSRVLIMTETTSNLHHPAIVNAIDQLIAPLEQSQYDQLRPNLLVTLGGMIVSKKVKAFLRTYSPEQHWHVGPKRAYDTFFSLTRHFKSGTNNWLQQLSEPTESLPESYQSTWLTIRDKRRLAHKKYLDKIAFCDFKAYRAVLGSIPQGRQLQVANSAAIRYTQLFELDKSLEVFCNRGTSGIDGSTSTAIGAAVGASRPIVFITGDLSFFYDSNALWNNYIPANFRIVLINNQGGGIFRILPGDKNSQTFSTYFETKHKLNAQYNCEQFGIDYISAKSEAELLISLTDFFKEGERPKLLEVFTPSALNDKLLLDYFTFIK